jgi:hypothetical protein
MGRIIMKLYHLSRVVAVCVGIVSAVGISACKTPSSEVTKLGPDIYSISTDAPAVRGGSVEARRIALSEASAFCARNGKEAFVINFKTSKNNAEVTFRCEEMGQQKLQQP